MSTFDPKSLLTLPRRLASALLLRYVPESPMTTTVRQEATLSRPSRSLPVLRLLYSGKRGPVVAPPHVLRVGETQLGREVGAPGALALPEDHRSSRLHAVVHLDPRDGTLRIEDRRSTNGTFVNGRRVEAAPLAAGDLIRIGDSFLLLTLVPGEPVDATVPSLLGTSPAIQALRTAVAQVARTEATVLLLGETGTGKEVAAHAIHAASARAAQPIQIFDCGAISRELVESELFGHEKGAFTGAAQSRKGLFESAQGSTLFIDEVGELPLDLQPKLLRALEQREIRRVGGARPFAVDVRIVAATNRDLADEVRRGRFRADLYARFAEVVIRLPPLRERREDVLQILGHALGDARVALAPALVEALLLHRWPFNVREVYKLAVQLRTFPDPARQEALATQLRDGAPIEPKGEETPTGRTPSEGEEPPRLAPLPPRQVGPPPAEQLAAELARHGGNVSALARSLGISRRQLHRWLNQLELTGDSFRGAKDPSKPSKKERP
jgi:DNA-binding NtrC family response regulator